MNDETKAVVSELPKVVEKAYGDILKPLLQPSATQIGSTLGEALRVALMTVNDFIHGYEHAYTYVKVAVPMWFKKHGKGADKVTTPDPQIAIPLMESLRYATTKEELREMYANLLSASMDIDTKDNVLPSFVSALKEFDPTSCLVLKAIYHPTPAFAISVIVRVLPTLLLHTTGSSLLTELYVPYSFPEFFSPNLAPDATPLAVSISLRNMQRLGIVQILEGGDNTWTQGRYDSLYQHPFLVDFKKSLDDRFFECECRPLTIRLTDYGLAFANMVL